MTGNGTPPSDEPAEDISEKYFSDSSDPRPVWERLDPAEGVSTWDALFHFVDKANAVNLYQLELTSYGIEGYDDSCWFAHEREELRRKAAEWKVLLSSMTNRLVAKLLQGEVVAQGYSNQQPLDAPRRDIAPDRWRDLDLDVQNSTASGRGLDVTQILIFSASVDQTRAVQASGKGYSAAKLRQWYVARVDQCSALGRMPSREDDYLEANEAFQAPIPRRALRALRRELAPGGWTRQGRRKG